MQKGPGCVGGVSVDIGREGGLSGSNVNSAGSCGLTTHLAICGMVDFGSIIFFSVGPALSLGCHLQGTYRATHRALINQGWPGLQPEPVASPQAPSPQGPMTGLFLYDVVSMT